MKKMMKKIFAVAMAAAVLMSSAVSVGAAGTHSITVHNESTTGIYIGGHQFEAYQIFSAADLTSYEVSEKFEGYFTGVMNAGDGSGGTFDFATQLGIINDVNSTTQEVEAAEIMYNHMAGLYMDSFKNNMHTLADLIRDYVEGNSIATDGTAVANASSSGDQTAIIYDLNTGYYFVMDKDSEMGGLGVAHSGAFVPLMHDAEDKNTTIEVKNSVPTVEKKIFHNDYDENKWDDVGDHQIGDTVEFLVTSTLPSNIKDYTEYTYIISDKMSAGLSFDGDVTVYMDPECNQEIPFYTVDRDCGEADFEVRVDVIELMKQFPGLPALYTYYTATVNSDAAIAPSMEDNTITLTYSNNPHDNTQTGSSEDTVFHYTFSLDVAKIDEKHEGLADARFGLFDENDNPIPLSRDKVDADGVVHYFPNKNAPVVADGGYITTETNTLPDGSVVTGRFRINGLDDAKTYILREVEAPKDYNKVDDISFELSVDYNDSGFRITSMTSNNTLVHIHDNKPATTIMNLKTVYLPATGGMGTTIFQISGGVLMLGGALFLIMSRRKNAK